MALLELNLTATPVNLSALLNVGAGSSVKARGINLGQFAVYRAVSENAPPNLDGAVWLYNPGESWSMMVYAGATDGNTWLMSAGAPVRVVIEDNLP